MSSILFVGGTRSGKSRLAEKWAEQQGTIRQYIATALAEDVATKKRIGEHQKRRTQGWSCLEAPYFYPQQLQNIQADVVLLDCLSMWLNNHMAKGHDDKKILSLAEDLARWIKDFPIPLAVVTSELGLGMVPMSELARRYRDLHGELNQIMANACQNVIFVSCGFGLSLKGKTTQELKII